jgi:hypothetical protein
MRRARRTADRTRAASKARWEHRHESVATVIYEIRPRRVKATPPPATWTPPLTDERRNAIRAALESANRTIEKEYAR